MIFFVCAACLSLCFAQIVLAEEEFNPALKPCIMVGIPAAAV